MKPSWLLGISPFFAYSLLISFIEFSLESHVGKISTNNSTFQAPNPTTKVYKKLNESQRFLLLEGDFLAHDSSLEKIDFSLLCSDGIPLLRENDVPKSCDQYADKPGNGCPPNFWCHIGINSTLNFCCPKNQKISNPCHLPPNSGFGTKTIIRYWYDWRAGRCRELVYTGFGGNENNFLSKSTCENKCKGTEPPSDLTPDSFAGNEIGLGLNNIEISPSSNKTTTSEKTSNPCGLSPDKGKKEKLDDKSVLRWYYDVAAEMCIQFHYLGHAGNQNNFVNEQNCVETCGGGKHEISSCLYPMNHGSGDYSIPRFYYNAKIKSCKKFSYKGSGGNMNRFSSRSTCEKVCIKGSAKSAKAVKISSVGQPSSTATAITNQQPFSLPSNFLSNILDLQKSFTPIPIRGEASTRGPPDFTTTVQTTRSPPNAIGTTTLIPEFPTLVNMVAEHLTESPYRIEFPQSVFILPNSPIRTELPHTFGKLHPQRHIQTLKIGNLGEIMPNTESGPPHIQIKNIDKGPIIIGNNRFGNYPIIQENFPLPQNLITTQPAHILTSNNGSIWEVHPIRDRISNTQKPMSFMETICLLPKDSGRGNGKIERWFYDPLLNRCLPFIFGGLEGNRNNFAMFETCQKSCDATNPCAVGEPHGLLNNDEQSFHCNPSESDCPQGFFCTIGMNAVDNVCCPRVNGPISGSPNMLVGPQPHQPSPLTSIPVPGHLRHIEHSPRKYLSPCAMNLSPGQGERALHRWAYNENKKSCDTFVYNGEGGNQNNFLTKSDCINTCAGLNPCSNGFPLVDNNHPLRCSHFGQTCPHNYYCHIGGTEDTTVCCPKTGDLCRLPLSTGGGSAILNRYYFDASSSTCKAFTYTGMNGNENNFVTLAECRKACPEYENPCPSGSPAMHSDGSASFCTASNPSCPSGYFCHIGEFRKTTLCCPISADGASDSKRLNLRRYPLRGTSFKHHDPCTFGLRVGNGPSQLPRYYYNAQSRTCQAFIYTGKGGNENNFVSKTECEASCPVLDNPCSSGFPALLDVGGEPILCSTALQNVCPAGFFCHIGSTSASTICCPGAGDPCRMPVSKGNGNAVLNRWYYNEESRVCVSFVYSGRGGNQNNFISRQDCLNACPEYTSPCPEGQPHIGLSGQITHCGATSPSICPTTFWCHIGATLDTSVCCPGAADPCDQDLEMGNGNAQLLRYHYNQMTRTCQQFRYSGLGGNENNFMTIAACESRCPVFSNPCALGPPQMDDAQDPISCSAADDSTCNDGYFCHIGDTEQTTICCSTGSVEICSEPRVTGSGMASLPRFYYSALTKQCLPFIYTGMGGNQNNFLSKAACESACEVLENPCANGEPATETNGQYITCSSSAPNVCPSGYWCHIGNDIAASVCCLGADNPCALTMAPGKGVYSIPRWHFDSHMRRCTRFTYTGKGGNSNNFVTLQECQSRCPEFLNPCTTGDPAQAPRGGILFCSPHEKTCPSSYWCHIGATHESTVCCPSLGDPCLSAMSPGTGSAKLPRWYFNQNSRQCLQFTYTGSGGNSNNFLSEQDCISRCPVFINPCPNMAMASNHLEVTKCSAQHPNSCPSGYWCHIGGAPDMSVCCPGASDPCQLPVEQGVSSGIGPFTRWHFDLVTRTCKPFQYTGIGGNENSFLTKEDCAHRCPEFINPCYNGEPYREPITGLTRYCSANSMRDCPNGHYCHAGSTPQTTVCCPGGNQKPCSMPLAVGTGSENLPRWYFNRHVRSCEQFTYTGLTGNNNNFVSKEACAKSCTEFNNPCGNGQPLTSPDGAITYCSALNPFICPMGYFCHVGSVFCRSSCTVCCPGATNPCQLPLNVGTGSSSLPRYSFNQRARKCQQFAYTGSGGNSNNFVSLEACRNVCPEFNNPCIGGEPFQMVDGAVFHCDFSSPCPQNYYCHFGIDTTSTVCCPALGGSKPCTMPVSIGSGQASITRYYFNTDLQQCVPFIYTGLGGNQNNFLSLHDCVNTCIGVSPFTTSPCPNNRPCDRPSMHSFPRPQFLSSPFQQAIPNFEHTLPMETKQEIRNFNKFSKTKLCPQGEPMMTSNGIPNQQCPNEDYVCNVMNSGDAYCCPDPRNFCLLPRIPGDCQSTQSISTKFGYNPITDTCVQFKFSGCGGNLNQFNSLAECTNICCNKGYNLLMKFHDDHAVDFHETSTTSSNADTQNISKPSPMPYRSHKNLSTPNKSSSRRRWLAWFNFFKFL